MAERRSFRNWLEEKLQGHTLIKHILTLLSGTVLAQVVTMLAAVVTARLFTPEAFGQFAVYGSITAIAITIASLRFDMAIMLPKDDDAARTLARLATRSNIVVAVAVSLLAFLLRDVVIDVWGSEELANWLMIGSVSVFLVAQLTVLQYWYNRKSRYDVIATNRVHQAIGSAGGQLGFGLAGITTMAGLLGGTLVGQVFAFFNLQRKARDLREPVAEDTPSMMELAKRYKRMPLLNLPNALIDSLRLNGITMLIGAAALGAVGQFNLAWRVLHIPIGLIAGSVSQVFFQHLARTERGRMTSLVKGTIGRLALAALVPFAVLYGIAPWLFIVIFGEQWDAAGDFARAITPWLYFQVITSPISTIFVVTETQHWMLIFSVFYAAVPLSILAFSTLPLLTTMTILGAVMATMLAMQLVLAMASARRYDRLSDAG